MGACSTHLSLHAETGLDCLRLLFEVDRLPERGFQAGGWNGGAIPSHGQVWLERKPGADGLWSPEDALRVGEEGRQIVRDNFGVHRELGVSRADITTTRTFAEPKLGRAFMAGMAALEFPRLAANRRGTPPHSVWWTGAKTRKIRNRVYDKSREQGGEWWRAIRLEDQRAFPAGGRPSLETVCDGEFQREKFLRRFEPMRKAVNGVKAASFPVLAQALADEFRYGVRDLREFERLAGTMVALSGGAHDAYARSTYYKRRAELMRSTGYVVVDEFMEPVEVDLEPELDAALGEFGS